MAKKLLVNPYELIKHKRKSEKTLREIKWGSNKPESIWDRSDFKDAFEIDKRAWEPVFFRIAGR